MKKYILIPWQRLLHEPAFILCTIVLAASAFGLRWCGGGHLLKQPLALRKSLDRLDANQLSPYEVVELPKIKDKSVEEALGTQDYIQWQLLDTDVPPTDPFYCANLFVTYYTGNPDKVPHVPDWCYVGSGGIVDKKHEVVITAPDCGVAEDGDQLKIRVLEIKIPRQGMGLTEFRRKIVAYVFRVNGTYACTRTQVRMKQRNRKDRYAYFSKVEVWFEGGDAESLESHLESMESVYQRVLPLLYSDHWPDWEAASQRN